MNKNYLFKINEHRLNRLLQILQNKENDFKELFKNFNSMLFNELYTTSINAKKYLFVNSENKIQVTQTFLDYLEKISNDFSLNTTLAKLGRGSLFEDDYHMVIVVPANEEYYRELQATVFTIHKHFPKHHLIIYDLGLSAEMLEQTRDKCKCEIRSLKHLIDNSKSHIFQLKKYAWKPIIIQDVLKDYEHVMYADASVDFLANDISPLLNASRFTGFVAQNGYHKLPCYTDLNTFKWFNEEPYMFNGVQTVSANLIIFYRNIISTLILKAWITCALDETCISPNGSRLWPCCGCHRFDQSALTIISTFFFNIQDIHDSIPPFSFGRTESTYFYDIYRGHRMNYF